MCCESQRHHHGPHGHSGAFFGGGANLYCGPCFSTKEEKLAWLEQCGEGLRQAMKTVEERITKLKDDKK